MRYFITLITWLVSFQMAGAQSFDAKYFNALQWRCIGPHRGGRTVGAVGVPGQPNIFYIGVNNGGVWKTNDFGRTWNPIFDDMNTGSIGDVAVAPSNPNTIYVAAEKVYKDQTLAWEMVCIKVRMQEKHGRTWALRMHSK